LGKFQQPPSSLINRDVEVEAGSGPSFLEEEAEAQKFYRFRLHIGYLTVYSGHISALMFCGFLLRNSQYYSIRDSR